MKRYPKNPILTRADIPDVPPFLSDVSSVFNPGADLRRDSAAAGEISLLLRVQARSRETAIVPAHSADGVHFRVEPKVVRMRVGESVRLGADLTVFRDGMELSAQCNVASALPATETCACHGSCR